MAQEDFTNNLKPPPTSPELRTGREEPPRSDETKLRQRKLGELCWVATASRLDVCGRLVRFAPRINALYGSDVYRISELVRVLKGWQQAAALMYASTSCLWKTLGVGGKPKDDL